MANRQLWEYGIIRDGYVECFETAHDEKYDKRTRTLELIIDGEVFATYAKVSRWRREKIDPEN